METVWGGFVNAHGRAVYPVEIYVDGEYVNVFVDGEIADQLDNTVESFIEEYGEEVSDSIAGFGSDLTTYSIRDVWPKNE